MSTYEPYRPGQDGDSSTPAGSQRQCPSCGGETFDPGFLEDAGESSGGYGRWIAGRLERGIFGGAKRFGKQRFAIEADRCAGCGHLMLYARTTV